MPGRECNKIREFSLACSFGNSKGRDVGRNLRLQFLISSYSKVKSSLVDMGDTVHRIILHFSGRVQGVGFRYHTLQLAKGFEVSGYVKNLPDGRVLVEAEGLEEEVTGFRAEIEEQLEPFIRNVEYRSEIRPSSFRGFIIK